MAHPLDSPQLYRRCFRFAMSLVRGWPNREEEAIDIVHDGYILAMRFTHQWKREEISFEQWVVRKVRDAWRKWIEKRSMLKRKLIGTMIDNLIHDEDGNEVEPEIVIGPNQEDHVYLQERIAQSTPAEQHKIAQEITPSVEALQRNYNLGVDRRSVERWDPSETKYRCEPDLWAKRQIARCDLRRARQNRSRFRLAFA